MAPSTHSLWPSLPPKNHGGTFHSFHGKCGNASGAGTSIFYRGSLPELSKISFARTQQTPSLDWDGVCCIIRGRCTRSVRKHRCTDPEHQHWPRHYEQAAAVPVISPRLNSRAGETMALAKPVMGTGVPAPARSPACQTTPSPVSSAAARIRVVETTPPAASDPSQF